MNEPIHVAVVRTVKPGCEKAFEQALQEFFQASFAHGGVLGATMIVPPPGSDSREFGILRTFAGEKERDAFYQSAMFRAWEEKARTLTEGAPVYRQLHGLEAWFRSPAPPPRWKMAVATYLGVLPVVILLSLTLGPAISSWHFLFNHIVFNLCVVALLTWIVMPLVTRALDSWLQPKQKE
jgi:antibiotic biosynthesis monooxygenase (ABM) superfamily enzyme